MKTARTLFVWATLAAIPARVDAGDTLAFELPEYIRTVVTLNEDLKSGSFKVRLAEVDAKVKTGMSPLMLSTSFNDKHSSQRPTDSRDTGSVNNVTQQSDAFNLQISKTFISGTNVGIASGYSFSGTNSNAELAALRKRHTTNINVNLTQPLLSGVANFIQRRDLLLSQSDLSVRRLEYAAKVEATMTKSIETYYALLQSFHRLSVIRAELDLMRTSSKTKEELVAKGFESRDKLLAYRTQILEKENEQLSLRNSLQSQRFAFFELISRVDPEQEMSLVSPPMEPFDPLQVLSLDTLYALARRKRIDFQIAERALAKATLTLTMQKSATLPNLDLTANYYIYGTDANFGKTFSNMRSNDYNSWSVALSFASPLGGKSRRDKLLPSQISLEEAAYRKTTTERKMLQEVQAGYAGLTLCAQQYAAAQENLGVAQTNLKDAEEMHEKGFIQFDDLSKNRRNYEQSQFQLFKTMCDFTTRYFKLKQAVGTLLDEFDIPD
jgi:outer membrane protein TolC